MWTIYKNHIIWPSLIDFLMEVLSIRIIICIGLFFVYVIILGYLIWQLNFVILGKIINWLLLPVIVWYCDMLTIKCFISVSINIWILYDLTTKITVVQLRNFSVKAKVRARARFSRHLSTCFYGDRGYYRGDRFFSQFFGAWLFNSLFFFFSNIFYFDKW